PASAVPPSPPTPGGTRARPTRAPTAPPAPPHPPPETAAPSPHPAPVPDSRPCATPPGSNRTPSLPSANSRALREAVVVGTVCALRPEKGLHTLMEAFRKVKARRPGVKLAKGL